MHGQNKPIQVKLHNAQKAVSNRDQSILKNEAQAEELARQAKEATEKRQDDIDHYNMVTCNEIDPKFKDIQLSGHTLIVRMHKENYIKAVDIFSNGVPMYDAWIRQVDGRMHRSDREKWVDNPLPYVRSGVVVAMSPALIADQKDTASRLFDADPTSAFKPMEVGDIVHLEHFMYADKRFYPNKQMVDFIQNPENFRIQFFEGYIKINVALVEGVVLNKERFLANMSPYHQYKQWASSKGDEDIIDLRPNKALETKGGVTPMSKDDSTKKSFGRLKL